MVRSRPSHDLQQLVDENRQRWDELVPHHVSSLFYDVDGFRRGANTLTPIEQRELGPVDGLSLVHLQCHFGLDTLSLARAGATVTGVDLSSAAIRAASQLADDIGVQARFVVSDVVAASEALAGAMFDLVFTSWGVLGWLPDIAAWGRTVARLLAPGGRFYIVEYHPVLWLFDPEAGGDGTRQTCPYFNDGTPLTFESQGSYAAPDASVQNRREHCWVYELGAVVNSLVNAGLRLDFLNEHAVVVTPVLPGMVERDDGMWELPPDRPSLPLSFSIGATRP